MIEGRGMNLQRMPDLPELGDMARKLFGDIKKSVEEIIKDYKAKHPFEEHEDVEVAPKPNPGVEDSETSVKTNGQAKKTKAKK